MLHRITIAIVVLVLSVGCTSPEPGVGGPDAATGGSAPDAGADGDAGSALPSTIDVGKYPNGIVADDRHIYVVIGEAHTGPDSMPTAAGSRSFVRVYSASDGTLVKSIDVAGGGHSMRMTPDGAELYIAHFTLDQLVTVISTATLEVSTTIGGPLQTDISVPDALSISADGRYVYVGNNGLNSAWISRIDTATHKVDPGWRVDVTGGYLCWVEVSQSGDVVYANSWTGGTVQRKIVASQQADGVTSVGDYPHAVVLEPSGAYLYALVSGGNRLTKLDAASLEEVGQVHGPWGGTLWGGPVSGVLSSSGKSMFVANHAVGGVGVVDIDPESPTYDTATAQFSVGADPIFMALSSDGGRLFVANNESGTISVVDVTAFP
jgi:DNA-binding beta-propeller fold protein YncE